MWRVGREEGREGKEELSVTQQSILHNVLNYSPNPALNNPTTSVFVDIKCYIS